MKMKKANKKCTKGHGKLWKKGQSCSFNPEFKKHREEVKKRAIFGNRGEGNLTEALLAQHNRNTTENLYDGREDVMSVGGETALTNFTNCTLPSFNRLQKNWNSSSFLHKEMVAVLAAVSELLKNKGEEETETNYFAALMTTLDVADTDESITAVICLLAMILKRVNESVLKSQSKKVTESMVKLLIKYMNSDHCALLRNLLTVIYTFMRLKTNWTESSDELKYVLEFTTHQKPKVRKMAHHVIRNLLINPQSESFTVHPCAHIVAKFCVDKLENSGGQCKSRDTFYMLQLLQEIISTFPTLSIKKSCETIFKVMTLSNSLLTLCGLRSLQGLFGSKHKNLPADLNARIITALYDYEPNVKDSECLACWIRLMEKALINLYSLDEKLCISHLSKFFPVAVKCWLNETEDVMLVITASLKSLLHYCFNTISEATFDEKVKKDVQEMFHSVEGALSYQYHKAWGHALGVLASFFETVGKHCKNEMIKCLKTLGDQHDIYNFPHIPALEKTIGIAIEHMGPRTVLEAIPLQADSERPDFPRSWMLPLLRDHVKRTELKFFVDYFLDLAVKMKNRALTLHKENRVVESKLFEVVCSQIWSLLPGFCTEPTDMVVGFKEIARTLGITLKEYPSMRLTVLSSLRLLIKTNMDNDESKRELAKYTKNYLPILFNLYVTEVNSKGEENVRRAVYETCKLYLQITDKELCSVFFRKGMEQLATAESGTFKQHALLDLCKGMIPCIDEKEVQELYDYCKPLLKHENSTTKKKFYSLIKEICTSESEACKSFVKAHLEDLRLLLSETIPGLIPATKALRLNCLEHLVSQATDSEKSTVADFIPEAILCTKENNIKTRAAAYSLLVEIGHAFRRFTPDSPTAALKEYIQYLIPGLAECAPHLVSATILSIGRVMYEFKDDLDSDIINNLIDIMCGFVKAQSREVVVSALSFFKILFAVVKTDDLAQHVQPMILSLTGIAEDNQRAFRFRAKEIFTRLVRKFGYEMISKMMPANYRKQLTNIRKIEARKQRKKDLKDDDSDSEMYSSGKKTNDFHDLLADSDDDMLNDDEDVRGKKPRGKKSLVLKKPCLEEDDENDIIDFLDPAVNKRLITLQESKPRPKKQNDDFSISEDGKLIIEDENSEKSKLKKQNDERSAVLSELGASIKKRKFEDSDDEVNYAEDQKDSSAQVSKGIHRSLGSKAKRRCPGEEFRAKKAGGDVKKGKLEPYAYVPLNRQALNKRKQVKLKGQFKSFVKAAKRGAAVGAKKRKSKEAMKRRK